ncbi:MAG TPA: hypothetical protein VLC93_08160, partial [Myxococcota bacterium]|nr:hypothetical protein [Myxococcota bacterium]
MWLITVVSLMTAQANVAGPTNVVETTTGEIVPAEDSVNVEEDVKPTIDRFAWKTGRRRLFAATTTDLGYIYLRPRLALGYGAPHYRWMGVEINPIFSRQGVGGWGGVRFALPYIDIRAGARAFYAF